MNIIMYIYCKIVVQNVKTMKTKKLLILCFASLFSIQLTAQPQCPTPCPRSNMQIGDPIYQVRKDAFKKNKLSALDKHLPTGMHHPLGLTNFSLVSFLSMLETIMKQGTGMRVYFGAFCKTDDPDDNACASGKENQLIPIFVPTVESNLSTVDGSYYHQDIIPSYYIIDDKTQTYKSIKASSAHAWVNNYKGIILTDLNLTLLQGHADGDTKSLWYDNIFLKEWKDDIVCQRCTNPGINQISVWWAAFEKDQNKKHAFLNSNPSLTTLPVNGQMTLLFEVPGATVLTLDARMAYIEKFLLKGKVKYNLFASYDTGVPCPPATNCVLGTSL